MAGPIPGYKVLELANFIAGPFCGMMLADLGADVIKIEELTRGDLTRPLPPILGSDGAGFMILNRNKRSLALNLKTEQGKAIFLRLATDADVVVESFRPGTVADLGVGEDAVWKINPRVVYCHISGFGQTGPYRERAGLDLIAQGMSGLMSVTGEPGRPPVKCGVPIADLATALFACNAVLAALLEREHSGRGQALDICLYESAISLAIWELSQYLATGEVPEALGSAHRVLAPYRAFKTMDGYITLGPSSESQWAGLCQIVGLDQLRDDPRFATNVARKRNDDDLAALIEAETVTRPSAHWLELLDQVGIPAGPIYTYDRVVADPQVQARTVVADVEHPIAGRVKYLTTPLRFSRTCPEPGRSAPLLGEHSIEILEGLGYDASTIDNLISMGVLAAPARTRA